MLTGRPSSDSGSKGLQPGDIQPINHFGIPASANTVAYDSIQRMLAVGTLDGRIKLLGAGSAEATLTAPEPTPTKSLHILPNTGSLLRLDARGSTELWSVPKQSMQQLLPPPSGDAVTVLCPFLHDPYILAGCQSGSLRVLGLTSASHGPPAPGTPVSGLAVLPYAALPDDLGAPDDAPLASLAVARDADGHVRVAMLHTGHAVTIWLLRARQIGAVLACNSAVFGESAGSVTSLCWASAAAEELLTGHGGGSVLHWRHPPGSTRLTLVATYHVHDDAPRSAVVSVSAVLGPQRCVIVQGGCNADLPQSLSLLHLDGAASSGSGKSQAGGEAPGVAHVPWFGPMQGFALVRPSGSFSVDDPPCAVVTLSEGGLLCMFDLRTSTQEPFCPDLQAQPIVLTQCLKVPCRRADPAGLSLSSLRVLSGAPELSPSWQQALSYGSRPRAQPSCGGDSGGELLVTGHDNGSVSFWDLSGQPPRRLATTAPANRAVSAMALDCAAGVLATGHHGGAVHVFNWCAHARALGACVVPLRSRRGALPGHIGSVEQVPAGWQLVAQLPGSSSAKVRSLSVTALCWGLHAEGCDAGALLAVGWADGTLAVVDCLLEPPSVLWEAQVAGDAIRCLSPIVVPGPEPARHGSPERGGGGGSGSCDDAGATAAPHTLLLVATASASFTALGWRDGGKASEHWVTPKTAEPLLACIPLASDGTPCSERASSPHVTLGGHRAVSEPRGRAGGHFRESAGSLRHSARDLNSSARSLAASSSAQQSTGSRELGTALSAAVSAQPSGLSAELARGSEEAEEEVAEAEMLADARAAMEVEEQHQQLSPRSQGRLTASAAGAATRLRGLLSSTAQRASAVGKQATSSAKTAIQAGRGHMRRQLTPQASQGASPSKGSGQRPRLDVQDSLSDSDPPGSPPAADLPPPRSDPASRGSGRWACATATHVALVTCDSMRLYPVAALQRGRRAAVGKARLPAPQDGAMLLTPADGAAVVVFWTAAHGRLRVHRLPDFAHLLEVPLPSLTGWRWDWAADPAASATRQGRCALCADSGLLVLVGPCQEVLLVGIARPGGTFVPPVELYDSDLAAAAHAAERQQGVAAITAAAAAARHRASSVLHTLLAGHAQGGGRGAAASAAAALRDDLPVVFAAGASPRSENEDISSGFGGDDEEDAAWPSAKGPLVPIEREAPTARASAVPAGRDPRVEPVGARTADEIKRAYGRGPSGAATSGAASRAADASAVMSDNVARLGERGERLDRMNTRAEQLADNAGDFASMASQLNAEMGKPWWKKF